MSKERKLLVGLIGAGIQRSLTPALQEQEARHHGVATGAAPLVSILNGALITLTESPRSCLKPMLSFTSAVSFSISSFVSGTAVFLPLASTVWPWLTTTAALRRLTVPLALRVTRTVLSTS